MRKTANSPESVLTHVAWDDFVSGLVAASEPTRTEGLRSFDGGTVRTSPTGKIEKISFVRQYDGETAEDVSVFFDEIGQVSRIQRKLSESRSFDNGVRRWPSRKSLVSEVTALQEFDAEGRPVKSGLPSRFGHLEIHIHTKSFIGGTAHETANSFLEYDFEGKTLLPAGERIADMTSHFPGEDRINIYEFFMDSEAADGGFGELADPRSKTAEPAGDALVKTVDGKLNYRVYLGDDRIAVHMGDSYVTSFDQRANFGLRDVAELLERARNGGSGTVAVLVSEGVSQIIETKNA